MAVLMLSQGPEAIEISSSPYKRHKAFLLLTSFCVVSVSNGMCLLPPIQSDSVSRLLIASDAYKIEVWLINAHLLAV